MSGSGNGNGHRSAGSCESCSEAMKTKPDGNGHRSADSCESCSEAMKSKPVYSELSGYGAALRVSEVTSHPV